MNDPHLYQVMAYSGGDDEYPVSVRMTLAEAIRDAEKANASRRVFPRADAIDILDPTTGQSIGFLSLVWEECEAEDADHTFPTGKSQRRVWRFVNDRPWLNSYPA